jgi:hypothetical protein
LYSIGREEIKRNGNGERDMPTIVHFEIPSDDIERSKKFYTIYLGESSTNSLLPLVLRLSQEEWSIG